jgi:hypothetical protein
MDLVKRTLSVVIAVIAVGFNLLIRHGAGGEQELIGRASATLATLYKNNPGAKACGKGSWCWFSRASKAASSSPGNW